MNKDKLIETRGEEPAFIPGHVGESWQKVDFGLGASTIQSAPAVQDSLPPQQRHWARMIVYALIGAGFAALLYFILSRIFWPIF
jgi:hypothetical protein